MKTVIKTLSGFCLVFLTSGLFVNDLAAQEKRLLDPFTGIGIGIGADVFYTPGSSHEIIIEGNSEDVKELVTKVEDGMLKLRYEDSNGHRSKLIIHITSKELDDVSLSGSGTFRSEMPVGSEEMSISVSGSGKILFTNLEVEEMNVKISGSGDAVIEKGKAEEADLKISGSGEFNAETFEVAEFSAAISGSGSCKITVTDELDAKISGSGSVYYHGNPQINSTSSGSGKVRSL